MIKQGEEIAIRIRELVEQSEFDVQTKYELFKKLLDECSDKNFKFFYTLNLSMAELFYET